jgi:hypothetical protein
MKLLRVSVVLAMRLLSVRSADYIAVTNRGLGYGRCPDHTEPCANERADAAAGAFAMTALVIVEEPAPHVVQLTLNRPDQLNAMTAELCEALHDELRKIALRRSCRAVILTGAGRAFCAGVDLRGYGAAPANNESDLPRDRLDNPQQTAVEYEDRQQIMATFSNGVPEAAGAFLEKRPAGFED